MSFLFLVPPTTVQIKIADVNAPSEYNVKMAAQKDVAVECIAEEARPPPKFTWFLGEDPLNVSHIHNCRDLSGSDVKCWRY